jgi:hypothetical protein
MEWTVSLTSSQNTTRRRLPAFVDGFNKAMVFVGYWREIAFMSVCYHERQRPSANDAKAVHAYNYYKG